MESNEMESNKENALSADDVRLLKLSIRIAMFYQSHYPNDVWSMEIDRPEIIALYHRLKG